MHFSIWLLSFFCMVIIWDMYRNMKFFFVLSRKMRVSSSVSIVSTHSQVEGNQHSSEFGDLHTTFMIFCGPK